MLCPSETTERILIGGVYKFLKTAYPTKISLWHKILYHSDTRLLFETFYYAEDLTEEHGWQGVLFEAH
jgi:hypothetical protein